MNETTFNGWANYHTWNVALYIQNERHLYDLGRECEDYNEFLSSCDQIITPDGVSYTDPSLDIEELNEMIAEL